MIYGYDKTIHGTQKLNIEVDKHGVVVAVWFRCMALPFDVTIVGENRAAEMQRMSDEINELFRLNAVDVKVDEKTIPPEEVEP